MNQTTNMATKEERNRVDRFKIAFNKVHQFMHDSLNVQNQPFGVVLDLMLEKHLIKRRDYTFLDDCRELRNFVVHNKNLYIAVPSASVVENIERLAAKYEREPTVYNVFAKKVFTVSASDTLYRVMSLIEETSITQFPVYDDEGKFLNLLTENVLTRWLAKHTVLIQEMGFADLRDTAGDAITLHNDEEHWQFIPRHMTIAAATALFAQKPVLECLLITERGKQTETPIGIMTRSDALDMLDGKRDTQSHKTVNK